MPNPPPPDVDTGDEGIDFWNWQQYGERRGWVSDAVCATHDGIPGTPDENAEWEAGYDPCQHVLRLWPNGRLPAT